jgi:HlyD family secretion protein
MRKFIIIGAIALVLAAVGGLGVWYVRAAAQSGTAFRTEEAKRGDLLATISATGTVEPVDVVDVGAQVTGQIIEYGKDDQGNPINYGSVVHPGTRLAKIDPKLYQAKVNQSQAVVEQNEAKVREANANVTLAKANVDQGKAKFDQAKRDWDRALALAPQKSIAQADYDAYESAYYTNKAALAVNDAALVQAQAMVGDAEAALKNAQAILQQDQTNLDYCDIKSTVEGVIVDRRVTLGQTVQSSFNTPSLFLLALDLKKMTVWASVNEADIGQVKVGQTVHFTGRIRLNATMTQNVVTYTVEVDTTNLPDKDHPNGKLLPYLTANLHFEVDKREHVLLVSNEALRWRPDPSQVATDARADYQKFLRGKSEDATGGDAKPGSEGKAQSQGKAKKGKGQHWGMVWVKDGKYVRPVKVRLGLTDGTETEVVEGNLEEGATVIAGDAAQNGGGDSTTNPFAPQMFGTKKSS